MINDARILAGNISGYLGYYYAIRPSILHTRHGSSMILKPTQVFGSDELFDSSV